MIRSPLSAPSSCTSWTTTITSWARFLLRRLLTADPTTLAFAIRDENVISVTPEMDQEEVARIVAKYDLVALPVVDQRNRLVGTITVDDVVDIVHEEASEDIFRMAGSDAAELERRSPRQVALLRLPWVLATLVIELLAGVVIHYFDQTLSRVILLASFMPVIQAISGNTGLQSVTMVVRGLATGQVQGRPMVGAAAAAGRNLQHPGRNLRAHRRSRRLAMALGGVRGRGGALDVHLGEPFRLRRDDDPHAVQAVSDSIRRSPLGRSRRRFRTSWA